MVMSKTMVAGFVTMLVSMYALNASAADGPAVKDSNAYRLDAKQLSAACNLLNDKEKLARMDGLKLKLAYLCGRSDLLAGAKAEAAEKAEQLERQERGLVTDTPVSDPTGESGPTQTQSETSISRDETTGVLCSGFNDAYSGVVTNAGFTGFSSSNDNGTTFTDRGAFDPNSFGDPAMVWRRIDGNFYLATLHNGGLGFYASTDQCQTMNFVGLAHSGGGDDKEFVAVDNNPASPYYGRIHLVWIDFNAGARIYAIYSDDASTWSSPVALSSSAASVQGAWPAVAPDGTVYTSWVRFSGSTLSMEVTRSTDGGDTWTQVANSATGVTIPQDLNATNFCGRTALKGNVRYLPSPQIVVSPDGNLHTVYTYDPDGSGNGNASDVFYRRSTDQGASWETEIRLNDDGTETDQYFATLSVSPTGRLVVGWYDRRLDPNNLRVDYYATTSTDGGVTWEPNERISDESSDIYIDPGLASCYHGDYDQNIQDAQSAFIQWSDDRAIRSGHADPDVYLERKIFAPDFFLTSAQSSLAVCAPDDAVYDIDVGQALNFSDPVTLSASGVPAGATSTFATNPVIPGGSTVLTIGNTAAASAGTYSIDITGNAAALERSVGVTLALSTQIPVTSALLQPANGATDVLAPTYSWTASAQAASYLIEVATDAAFSNIVDSATVQETSYSSSVLLAPETQHFWRVSATNSCGTGSSSPVFSFVSAAVICNTTVVSIPDNASAGVDSASVVAGSGTITDLNVSLRATHTYVGDLEFTLTHNTTGTSVTLIDRPGTTGVGFGCSNGDVDATMDDEATLPVEDQCAAAPALGGFLIPQEPLSAFDGEDLAGEWTLNVSDNAGQDTGTLDEWCLFPTVPSAPDADNDSVADSVDNCTNVANAAQEDGDGDGIGNICDTDLNNDCTVDFLDLGIFKQRFFGSDAAADFNSDGTVDFLDLGILKMLFFGTPGPAASPNVCD